MAIAAKPGGARADRYQAYDRQRVMARSQSDCDAALKRKSRQSQGQIHRRAKSRARALGILRVQIAIPSWSQRTGESETMTQIQAISQDADESRGPVHRASLRARRLRRILRHHPLRHRLRLWPRGAKGDHRHRNGGADCGGSHRQPAPDVRLRRSAQRDGAQAVQAMVDAIRAEIGRTQHLRAVLQSRAHAAVLAMASDAGGGLAHRQSAGRLGGDRDCRWSAG